MHFTRLLACVLVVIVTVSCDKKKHLYPQEGFLDVNGGKIWYRVVGEGDATPLLVLHGGPSFPSYYLDPLRELSTERPVIFFDQLGCGRSDRITDTTLMTIDAHIDQIIRLLDFLDVKDIYLYGHSWGSMLGLDYYLQHGDDVKALVFAGPCMDAKRWVADADTLISQLPDSVRVPLQQGIQGVVEDSARLISSIIAYTDNYYARRKPVSPSLDSSMIQMGGNVYEYMWGSNEFQATGTLKNYDRTADLGRIAVPILYIAGEFDSARPSTVRYYQSLTPSSRLLIVPGAGHFITHDNPAPEIEAVQAFLAEMDNR
jgi:proline iminopeptidase